jgi:hypothetical protein
MSRITCPLAVLGALLLTMPVTSAAQCEREGVGDICASGSPWYEFTRVRIEPLEKSGAATTMTLHPDDDFSLDIGADGSTGTQGKIMVMAGRAMLTRGVSHEKGYEIDARGQVERNDSRSESQEGERVQTAAVALLGGHLGGHPKQIR